LGLGVVPDLHGAGIRPTLMMTLDPKLTPTKGGRERTVEVSKDLADFLWGYIHGEREVLAAGYRDRTGKNPPDRVFLGRTGVPLSRSHLDKVFKEVSRRCGLGRPVTPHMIRHTFGTYELLSVMEGGLNSDQALAWVQERMGHASPDTTERYLHLARLVSRKTMDKHQERVTALFKGKLNG
jgi:integrase